jgi:hypothetical protein
MDGGCTAFTSITPVDCPNYPICLMIASVISVVPT